MFPIRDHNPSRRTPWVTWTLLAANIVIFLLYYPAMSSEPYRLAAFWQDFAIIPEMVSAGNNPGSLVTSMFLHGGWMHLAGNMLYLWIFGDNMEDALGHVWFTLFYLLGGIAAGLLQVFVDPYSEVPVVGASGAIAAVLGGYLMLFPKAKVDVFFFFLVFFKIWPIRAWIVLGVWIALQLMGGFGDPTSAGGVAHWAHIGGFVAGIILVLPWWFRHGGKDYWKETEGHPPHPETQYPERVTSVPVVRRRR